MNKKVKAAKKAILKYNILLAKSQLKTNEKLKAELRTMRSHFKTGGWDISYHACQELCGVSNFTVFNIILDLKGYRVVQSKATYNLVIRKTK